MFCENCGNKRKNNDKFCENCGNKFEVKNKDNKALSITGLVLSIFLPLIGIVLSIISLIKGEKKAKEDNEKNSYLVINIIGIVLGFVLMMVYFIFFIFWIVSFSLDNNKDLIGKYECSGELFNPTSIYFELNKDKSFKLENLTDDSNTSISGTYSFGEISRTDYISSYTINFNVKDYLLRGEKQNLDNYNSNVTGRIHVNKSTNAMQLLYGSDYYSCHEVMKTQ